MPPDYSGRATLVIGGEEYEVWAEVRTVDSGGLRKWQGVVDTEMVGVPLSGAARLVIAGSSGDVMLTRRVGLHRAQFRGTGMPPAACR